VEHEVVLITYPQKFMKFRANNIVLSVEI